MIKLLLYYFLTWTTTVIEKTRFEILVEMSVLELELRMDFYQIYV